MGRLLVASLLVDDDGVVAAAFDEDGFVVAAREGVGFGAGADGAAVEGAFQAELAGIAGDLVAEDANVTEDGLDAGSDFFGVGERPLQAEVEGGVVEEAAQRSLAAVK